MDLIGQNLGTDRLLFSQRVRTRLGRLLRCIHQFNPAGRSRANVAHHYDLSGQLFGLFLDRDRQYSCAYFPTGT